MSVNDFKTVVLGSGGVGKSSLTIRLITDNFLEEYDATIEDSYQKTIVVDGESTTLHVLDTAGQEEYVSMQDQWMREGRAFLLVYSITDQKTFEDLNKIREKILRVKQAKTESSVPLILVGNKCDLKHLQAVITDDAKSFAEQNNLAFIETSAMDSTNVDVAFETILIEIYRIVTRKTLDPTGDNKPGVPGGSRIVLEPAAGGKKKGGCC